MGEYVTALGNVTARLETYKHRSLDMPAEIIQELEQSCCVFRQKLSEQARHMAWVSDFMKPFFSSVSLMFIMVR